MSTRYINDCTPVEQEANLGPPRVGWRNLLAQWMMTGAFAVCLMGSVLPTTSFAATIQGVKYNADNGDKYGGHFVFARGGAKFYTAETAEDGSYKFINLPVGTYTMWSGIPDDLCQSAPVKGTGHVPYEITLSVDTPIESVDLVIAQNCSTEVPTGDPCEEPTISSTQSGNWNDPIWKEPNATTTRNINAGDLVRIETGHTITAPNSKFDLETGALCIKGTLQSTDNVSGQSATQIEIHANSVYNAGTIQGKDGKPSSCGQQAGAGSGIIISAKDEIKLLANGRILAGNGANAPENAGHPCPKQRCGEGQDTYAGAGGSVEIYSEFFESKGVIISGKGGNAGAAHAQALGGDGGIINITTNMEDERESSNLGMLKSGAGGVICAPALWWQKRYSQRTGKGLSAFGKGGDMHLFLEVIGGKIDGNPGSMLYYDPINIKADSSLRIAGFDSVEIYTDEGGTIDLTQLTEGAISAKNTIKISTKSLNGKGGTVDLRGVSSKVFQAGEKVEIFADEPIMDEGVTIETLAEAPEVAVSEGKIVYNVALSAESRFVGETGTVVTIPLNVNNSGPKTDTYTFSVIDSAGWQLGTLSTTQVDGLKNSNLMLKVTLPVTQGAENVITITATSQTDPTVTAVINVNVGVNAGDDSDGDGYPDSQDAFIGDASEWLDSDGDGIGDNADPDDDNDGMLDIWENQYEGLSCAIDDASDDADEDGFSNLEENQANTNPDDPESKPVVVIPNVPPTAALTVTPKTGEAPLTVALDGSTSTDTDGTIASYAWTASDGQTASGQNAELTFNDAGDYTITLEVTDDKGATNSATGNITAIAKPQGEYTAYGTIRDELGNKLAGVEVQVAGQTVTTDAAGNWEVPKLPEGEYTVTVSKDGYTFAPENVALGNDEFRQETVLKPLSNLKVKVVAQPRTVVQNDNVTYIATVINGGDKTATGIVLTNVLPENAGGLVSIEALDGGECDAATVTCTLPDLTTGNSARVKLVVSNTQAKSLLNTATVTTNEYPADVQKTRTRVIPYLAASITDTPEPLQLPLPGEERVLHYDVAATLSANAPTKATGVNLVMTLPKGVELQAINSDFGMCDTSELPVLTCSMTDLSVASADDISHVTVGIDVVLKDAGLLALTLEAKLSANEYPVHTDKERTSIFIDPEYKVGLAFVIDDSGSMQGEINQVKVAANGVIDELLGSGDTLPLSVLLTFGDQVKYRAVTQDVTVLRDAIANIKVSGGGTCPEASYEAISFAIPHLSEDGTILFATDASPYEGSDTDDMIARLRSNAIVFNALIFGDCSDENSWNQ